MISNSKTWISKTWISKTWISKTCNSNRSDVTTLVSLCRRSKVPRWRPTALLLPSLILMALVAPPVTPACADGAVHFETDYMKYWPIDPAKEKAKAEALIKNTAVYEPPAAKPINQDKVVTLSDADKKKAAEIANQLFFK